MFFQPVRRKTEPPEKKAQLVLPEQQAHRVNKAPREPLGRRGTPVLPDLEARRERPELPGRQAHKECRGRRGTPGPKVHKEYKAYRGRQA